MPFARIFCSQLRGKQRTVELKETHSENFTVEGDFEAKMELTERQQLLYGRLSVKREQGINTMADWLKKGKMR